MTQVLIDREVAERFMMDAPIEGDFEVLHAALEAKRIAGITQIDPLFKNDKEARDVLLRRALAADARIAELEQQIKEQEGYPGIAHDFEKAKQNLEHYRQQVGKLEAELSTEREARQKAEKNAARLVAVLKMSVPLLRDAAVAYGPCDHSVGICVCDLRNAVETVSDAIAQQKEDYK